MSASGRGYVATSHVLDAEETVGEFMMNALRLNEGFTLEQFVARTGLEDTVLEERLDPLRARELLLTENGGPVHLWKNNTVQGNYLRVRLKGTESNADGLGARIVVYAGDLIMQRRVRTGGTYMSQSELTASFGVAEREMIDSLYVYWPSGIEQKRYELPVNDEILVVESQE